MKVRILIGMALAVTPLAPVTAMPVSTFLGKVEALKRKGPLAIFSRAEIKRLGSQIQADGAELRKERLAAKAAGRPQAFCPPEGGVKMTDKDVLVAMEAVPPPQRARTSTKDAMRAYMAKRFPC
jgi:hypothetical protein